MTISAIDLALAPKCYARSFKYASGYALTSCSSLTISILVAGLFVVRRSGPHCLDH